MSTKTAKRSGLAGWDRKQLTLRLAGRRKELLAGIAQRVAPGCAPTEAIDRALDLALGVARSETDADLPDRVAAIERAIEASGAATQAELVTLRRSVDAMTDALAKLHALLRELASEEPAC